MYKQLLQETLPFYASLDKHKLVARAGITTMRLDCILDSAAADDVTQAEYIAITKALPVSIGQSIKSLSDATEELEYLEVQLATLAEVADDNQLPMFNGMARLVRRVIKAL